MKPSQFGLPYREVTITTKDNVSLQCYLLQQKDVEVAKKSPTVIYFHANAGNMVRFFDGKRRSENPNTEILLVTRVTDFPLQRYFSKTMVAMC
jgi:hypothetical protein